MPLTPAERQAKRRQKLKDSGQYEEYKKKGAQQKREQRLALKRKADRLPVEERRKRQDEQRKKTRERVAKHRALKKQSSASTASSPRLPVYKSVQALGRAVARAKRSLPQSPTRLHAVCQKLTEGIKVQHTTSPSPHIIPKPSPHNKLSDTTIRTAIEFYERDDISRQAPGRKDVVAVRDSDGAKRKMQVRHLTSSINEVYGMFINIHPDVKIGKSTFANLRPKHVLLSSKIPQNVCLCKYHENFILAVNALHKTCDTFPPYERDLIEKFTCETSSEDCWLIRCEKCSDFAKSIRLKSLKLLSGMSGEKIKMVA